MPFWSKFTSCCSVSAKEPVTLEPVKVPQPQPEPQPEPPKVAEPVPAEPVPAEPTPLQSSVYVVVEFGCNSSSNDMYAPTISFFRNREEAYELYNKVKGYIKYMEAENAIGYDGYSQSDNESVIQCGDGAHAAKRPIGVIIKSFTTPHPPEKPVYIVVKLSCDSGHNELNPPNIYLFYNRDDAYACYNKKIQWIIDLKKDKRSNIDYELIDDFEEPDIECMIQSPDAKRSIGVMITKKE